MNNTPMWLVYREESTGKLHYQHWRDVPEVGTLIDPDTGDDLQLVGWTATTPEDIVADRHGRRGYAY